jgi:hypothetical protein
VKRNAAAQGAGEQISLPARGGRNPGSALMYRLFRRFEKLLFGLVTASAVACTGFIVVERCGGLPAQELAAPQSAEAIAAYVLACEAASQTASCEPLLADWKEAK